MKDFREEILHRRKSKRTTKSSTWLGLLAKILLLLFIIIMIRFFGKPITKLYHQKQTNEINFNDSN